MKNKMTAFILIGSLLSQLTWAEAPVVELDPIDSYLRNERVYAPEGENFEVDERTQQDLDFAGALLPYLQSFSPSQLGRNRLAYLLTHPLIRRDDILERQKVIQTLANNPELLDALLALFHKVKKATLRSNGTEMDLQQVIKSLRGVSTGDLAFQRFMLGFFGVVPMAINAFAAITGQWRIAIFSLQMGFFSTQLTGRFRKENFLDGLESMRRASKKVTKAMSKLNPEDTHTLSQALAACKNQEICLGRFHLWNRLAMSDLPLSPLGDIAGVTAVPLGMAQKHLLKSLPAISTWLGALGELEAYAALADFYRKNRDKLIFPEILDSTAAEVEIHEGHLPYLRFNADSKSVANDVQLRDVVLSEDGGPKTTILTGPNAGGKTTFLRMLMTNLIMGQTGAPIPAASARLTPTAVFSNFTNVRDATTAGLSTFQVQSQRIGILARAIASWRERRLPSLVAMDEILIGTSVLEHRAGERAVLEVLHRSPGVLSLLATHDRSLVDLEHQADRISNIHVDLNGYKIVSGPSVDYNAFDVMENMGVPDEIVARGRLHLDSLLKTGNCEPFLAGEIH